MLALFLTEAAASSLLVLLLVPPRAAGRKFFQYTVAQSCALMLLGIALAATGGRADAIQIVLFGSSALLLLGSAGLFHLGRLEAGYGLMAAGAAPALLAVALDALALIPASDATRLSRLLYPLDAVTSGLVPGSVLIAMILGHYYMNIPSLWIGHLQRLTLLSFALILLRLMVVLVSMARYRAALAPLLDSLVDTQGRVPPSAGLDPFVLILLLLHLLFGVAAPAAMTFMAWRTSLISSTQSATGILYVALVMAIMGELSSRHALILTGLPL